jgi:hypothetical protein
MLKQATFVGRLSLGKTNIYANQMKTFDSGVNSWIEKNVEPGTEVRRILHTTVSSQPVDSAWPELIATLVIEYIPKSENTK